MAYPFVKGELKLHPGYAAFLFRSSTAFGHSSFLFSRNAWRYTLVLPQQNRVILPPGKYYFAVRAVVRSGQSFILTVPCNGRKQGYFQSVQFGFPCAVPNTTVFGQPYCAGIEVIGKPAGGGGDACTGASTLSTKCKDGTCKLVAKLKNGAPGREANFCVDGEIRCVQTIVNNRGKAKAVFANTGPGEHVVQVCDLFSTTNCTGTQQCAQEDCRCLYVVTAIWRRGNGSGCGYAIGQTRSWTGRHCPDEGVLCDAKNGRSCDRILFFDERGPDGCCVKVEWAGCTSIAPALTGANVAGCP